MDNSILDRIERFAVMHCGIDGPDARNLCRAFYQREAVDLPMPATEVGRSERALLASAIAAALAHSLPEAVAGQASPLPSGSLASPLLPELTGDARAAAIRAMAGPSLSEMAEALIASQVSVSDAFNAIAQVRAQTSAQARYPSTEERHAGQIEFGAGSFEPRMSRSDTANAGWKKAFASAERKPI